MKHTSQHYCDKTMDGKMALYHKCCFPRCTKSVKKVTFVGFREGDRPPLDPPLYDSMEWDCHDSMEWDCREVYAKQEVMRKPSALMSEDTHKKS